MTMDANRNINQGTEAWLLDRLGHVTGSRFNDVIAMGVGGKKFLKSRETTITEITLELLTGSPGAMWTSKATNWGKEHEPLALIAYESKTGAFCEQVGFIRHPKHLQVGCSPDGLLGNKKGWEAKCPLTATVHLDTLLTGMPNEHMAQVQGCMWCCDCDEWDFVSYHPLFPEPMQLYIETIKCDQAYIDDMESKVLDAVAEININVKSLLEKYGVTQ
jgi:hypothetical protein